MKLPGRVKKDLSIEVPFISIVLAGKAVLSNRANKTNRCRIKTGDTIMVPVMEKATLESEEVCEMLLQR